MNKISVNFVQSFLILQLISCCWCFPNNILEGRIVNGDETTIEDFPYQVSLRLVSNYHFCGGVIYSSRVIITAAHCLKGIPDELINDLSIVAGTRYLHTTTSNYIEGNRSNETVDNSDVDDDNSHYVGDGVEVKVKNFVIHERFNEHTYDSDIGILILSEHLRFNDKIQPIPILPRDPRSNCIGGVKAGTKVLVSGWGTMKKNGKLSNTLQYTMLSVVGSRDCQNVYNKFRNVIRPSMICAGSLNDDYKRESISNNIKNNAKSGNKNSDNNNGNNSDACEGDSGGPLITMRNDKKYLVGIVSWSHGCGKYPGVYSNVVYLKYWIQRKLAENNISTMF